MTTLTAMRALANPQHPYHRAPHRTWLITGSPFSDRYPCMCLGTKPCTQHCPCRGRTDHHTMPTMCCARRAAEHHHRATHRAESEHP
jgi:hypothetical protein